MIGGFLRVAERTLRVLFHLAVTLLIGFSVFRLPIPLAFGFAFAAGILARVGWHHLPAAARMREPSGGLHAELLSVSAAIALIVLSFVMRTSGRPFGLLDVVALLALAYFAWRVRLVRRHLKDGTLPAPRESGMAFARRIIGEAAEYGRSRRSNDGEDKIDR